MFKFCAFVQQEVKKSTHKSGFVSPVSYTEQRDRLAAKFSFMRSFDSLGGRNGFLPEIFDYLMNDGLILQLKLIASETFISSLKGSFRNVKLFNSAIRKCIIALKIAIISLQKTSYRVDLQYMKKSHYV